MRITINGEILEVPDHVTIEGLINHLELPSDRLAVERNKEVVSRTQWSNAMLEENDKIEIIHFVGGGLRRESDDL